jgi:hypothetical protein
MVSTSVSKSGIRKDDKLRRALVRLMFSTKRGSLVHHYPIDTRVVISSLRLGASVFSTPEELTKTMRDVGILKSEAAEEDGDGNEEDADNNRMEPKTAAEFLIMNLDVNFHHGHQHLNYVLLVVVDVLKNLHI